MPAVLMPNGKQAFFTTPGVPAVGYKLATFAAGTVTNQPTWADAAKIGANTNPIILDARGEAVIFWDGAYKVQLQDSTGAPIWTVDAISTSQQPSADFIPTQDNTFNLGSPTFSWKNLYLGPGDAAAFDTASGNIGYFAKTAAENAAGLTVINFSIPPYPINVNRYGILPNLGSGAAAAQGAILNTLLNYNTAGPTGLLIFPNTTGADVYTFSAVPNTVRQGLHLNLMGSTLAVVGNSAAGDVNVGFLYPLSDVIIENGTISTTVNTAAGTNSGACIFLGARGVGTYYTVFDSTQASGKSLGRCIFRYLTLINNNTGGNSAAMLMMLGGLSNVLTENITISCNGIVGGGVYYEWGWATSPPGTAATQTSHGHNMKFVNTRITNAPGPAFGLTGAYGADIEGLYTGGCAQSFVYSVGEAMFFNPWVGVDQAGAKRGISLKNVVGQGETGTGIQLAGSNLASGTYLSGAGLTVAQQTDLMTFTLDNVTSRSLVASGAIVARNCKFDAAGAALNPVTISDDCMFAEFINCQALNGTGVGFRANTAGIGLWAPIRQKYINWRGGLIAGNVGAGAQFNNTRAAHLTDVRIGYNSLYDGAGNEAVQTLGVSVGVGCQGVRADSCYVTTSGGNAYDITGITSSGCNISNPLGTVTAGGAWDRDGVASATGANLASAAFIINTNNKYFGRQCLNTSTNKMFIAQGSAATGAGGGTWISVDGATTITPV